MPTSKTFTSHVQFHVYRGYTVLARHDGFITILCQGDVIDTHVKSVTEAHTLIDGYVVGTVR